MWLLKINERDRDTQGERPKERDRQARIQRKTEEGAGKKEAEETDRET